MKRPPRPPIGCLLLLLFTVVPAAELILLIWFTIQTNFLATLALIVLTGVIGAAVAKAQGVIVLYEAQRDLALGRFPAQPLFEGILILLGGALLMAPGLVTDLIGLTVLVPPLRRLYAGWLQANLGGYFRMARPPNGRPSGNGAPPPPPSARKEETTSPGGQGQARPKPEPEQPSGSTRKPRSPFEDRSPFSKIRKKHE